MIQRVCQGKCFVLFFYFIQVLISSITIVFFCIFIAFIYIWYNLIVVQTSGSIYNTYYAYIYITQATARRKKTFSNRDEILF